MANPPRKWFNQQDVAENAGKVPVVNDEGTGFDFQESGGGGALLSATVTLTDAQIKALPTTPVELVAAPGIGMGLIFMGAFFNKPQLTNEYTNISDLDIIQIIYDGVSESYLDRAFQEDIASSITQITLLIGQTIPYQFYDPPAPYRANQGYIEPILLVSNSTIENKAIVLQAITSNGDFTGGNAANTLKVTVYYTIVDL